MAYTPPPGSSLTFEFGGGGYTPPGGTGITFVFTDEGNAIYPSGFSSFAAGTPTVYNTAQAVYVNGIPAGSVGSPAITAPQYLVPTGIAPGNFGGPYLARTIAPTGINSGAYGTPFIGLPIYPSGFSDAAYGTPTIATSKTLYPSGIESALAFGSAYVYDITTTRTIYANGVAAPAASGVHSVVRNDFQCIPVSTQFAELRAGIFDGALGSPSLAKASGAPDNQLARPVGIAAGSAGSPNVENAAKTIAPAGIPPPGNLYRLTFQHRMEFASDSGSPGSGPFYIERFGFLSVVQAEGEADSFANASPVGKYVPSGTEPPIQYDPGDVPPEYLPNTIGSETWMQDMFAAREVYQLAGDRSVLLRAALNGFNYGSLFSQRITPSPVSPSYIGASNVTADVDYGAAKVIQGAAPAGVRYLVPSGIAWAGAVGSPAITTNTLYAAGIEPAGFGSARIGWTQYVEPRGICPYRIFATVNVVEVPHYDINNAGGLAATRYGTADVSNFNRSLPAFGFSALAVGTPMVAFRIRYVYANGFEVFHTFGDPTVYDPSKQYIRPSGIASVTAWGLSSLALVDRALYVTGFDASAYGTPFITNINVIRIIYPEGIFAETVVRPDVNPKYIAPVGLAPGVVPVQHDVVNYNKEITLTGRGIYEGFVEYPQIGYRYRFLNQQSWASSSFGTTTFQYGLRPLLPVGFEASVFGGTTIGDKAKYVSGAGDIYTEGHGATEVTHYVQYVSTFGADASLYGTARVTSSFFEVQVPFMIETRFGTPRALQTQTITAAGFNNSFFGPDLEVLDNAYRYYFQGFASQAFGETTVRNRAEKIFSGYAAGSESPGYPTIENQRKQILVGPYADGSEPADYGRPYIENRVKYLVTFGNRTDRFGYPDVTQGPVIQAGGYDFSAFGNPDIDHRIRYRYLEGFDGSYVSPWTQVRNNAHVISAFGIPSSFVSGPFHRVFDPTQTIKQHSGYEGPITGTAYIDFAVRSVAPRPIDWPYMPIPQVVFNPQPINVGGIYEGFIPQTHVFEIRFTRIYPAAIPVKDNYVGEPLILNVKRILTVGPSPEQTEYGRPTIQNRIRSLYPEGYSFQVWGGPIAISSRNRYIQQATISIPAFSVLHHVRKAQPDPPGQQTLFPQGFVGPAPNSLQSQVPHPIVRDTTLAPEGIFGFIAPRPTVVLMGLLVQSFANYQEFGNARLNPTQYVGVKSINPPDNGTYGQFGATRLSPNYIYAPSGEQAPGRYRPSADPKLIDEDLNPPKGVGEHDVSHRHRTIKPSGSAFQAIGNAELTLKRQYIYPQSLLSYRPGFHMIPFTPQYVDLDTFNDGIDLYASGEHVVTTPPVYDPNVRPGGTLMTAFGSTRIELFNRNIYPQGIFNQVFGTQLVGYPRKYIWSGGDLSIFGTTWVSDRIRYVQAEGFDASQLDDDLIGFNARMRVRLRNNYSGFTLGETLQMGTPGVDRGIRTIFVFPWYILPSQAQHKVSAHNVVSPSGIDSALIGDIDRWEAGKIKPHGDDLSSAGTPRLVTAIRPSSVVGEMGEARVARPIRTYGFPPVGFDGPVLTDRCGCNRRAIAGYYANNGEEFGTAEITT